MGLVDRLLGRRGTGWRQNPPDRRDYDFDKLGLGATGLPDAHTLSPFVAGIRDQGSTNSCVGQALANAVTIRELAVGLESRPASALDIYWYGRYLADAGVIRDNGNYIRAACKAMVKRGVCDEVDWPMSEWKVNRQPPPIATMNAHPRAGGLYAGIFDIGQARLLAIHATLAVDIPLVAGFRIDDPFTNYIGPELIDVPSAPRYGHAMCIIGYRPDAIQVLQSWSPNWRHGGMAWLTNEYVLSTIHVGDITAIHGWRRLQEGAK